MAGGFGGDDDGDGSINGFEWYFRNSDPGGADGYQSPLSLPAQIAPGSYTFNHVRPKDRSDITESYEWSSDLVIWYASGESSGEGPTVNFGDSGVPAAGPSSEHETVTKSATVVGEPPAELFLRLRLSKP